MATKFRETSDPKKGRAAIAGVRLLAGTPLLTTDAYAAVSLVRCNWCFSATALKRCSGCQLVQYCSRACQRDDWTSGAHASECSAWKSIPQGKASQTVLLVARLAVKLLLRSVSGGDASGERDAVLALRHHYDDHSPQTLREFTEMAQLVVLVLTRSKANASSLGFEQLLETHERAIVELFCRINCNAFTICDDVNAPVGIGMFPRAALLNHSCVPNCVVSFARPQRLTIRTIRAIEPGEELTISYVELLESTSKRKHALRASYFFECECARCINAEREQEEEEDWLLDGYACREATCRRTDPFGVVAVEGEHAKCKACGHDADFESIQRDTKLLDAAEMELVSAVSVEHQWAVHQTIWQHVDQQLRCHPRSTRRANAARAMGNFLIDHGAQLTPPVSASASTLALRYLESERDATQWVLPTLALPSRGLLLFQLAKLRLATESSKDGHLINKDAEQDIREALAVLSIAYGSNHRMTQAAQAFLHDLTTAPHK